MEYDIFISYSRADTQIVDQFVTKLTDAGYRVWIDRDGIDGGDQFKTKIVRAIKGSALVVFFSSANSNASKWTVKEISYSLKKEKPILPVKLDEAEYAESIDFDLIDIDFIQYHSNRPTSATERLLKSVSKKLGKSQPPTAPNNPGSNLSPDELNSRGLSHYNKQEYEQAVDFFRKAAEQGLATAQFNLGVCYDYGKGVSQDHNEAVKWYRKAAEQGHATAQNNLGYCYKNGHGVAQDYNEAIKWYKKAAEQGHAYAQNNLGYCYENGQGVPKDLQKAIELYRKSAEQGHETAIYNLKRLGKWSE